MASREGQIMRAFVVFFAALMLLGSLAFADEGTVQGGGGEGKISRWLGKWSNPFGSLFSEISPADVGHKPRIKPHFAFNQGFNSNARLGGRQADAAWQARIAPGITVSIPSGKLYTEADYTYGFSTTQGRRTNVNINTHDISALARYAISADTTAGIANNFQISEVPGEGGDMFKLETATAHLKHRLSPKLSSSLSDTFQWFQDQTETSRFSGIRGGTAGIRNKEFNNEFVDNGVNVGLNYDVTSDLTAGPGFQWNVRNFSKADAKDYWQIQPQINVSYKLGPKTTLGGNFGWAFRRFENKSSTTGGSKSESELIYGASASHLYGRKLVWSVGYSKSLQDTFDTSFVFKDTPESTTLDNLDRDFRVIKSHRLGTSATYNLNEKNSVGVFGDFSFLEGSAKDDIINHRESREKSMEIGTKYTYRITRFITFDVLYAFGRRFLVENNNTNGGRNEYTFHKVTGGVNISI